MSLIESKTMCFGLLLIVNDIGDARETLPSPLWLKNKVMVRSGLGNGSTYGVWAYECTHDGPHSSLKAGRMMDRIREIVKGESGDYVKMYQLTKTRYVAIIPNWSDVIGRAWQHHLAGGGEQPITRDLWLLSKTGEVNLTKFKQDKKAAIAKFLAKIR